MKIALGRVREVQVGQIPNYYSSDDGRLLNDVWRALQTINATGGYGKIQLVVDGKHIVKVERVPGETRSS
jgi:hypothetical protein